jgi:hypothetical protein
MEDIQGTNSFFDGRSSRLENLPDFFISGRYGKSYVDIVEFLQNVDIPQDQGRLGLNGHGPLMFHEDLKAPRRELVPLFGRLVRVANTADPDSADRLFFDFPGQQVRGIDLDIDELALFFLVARILPHERGVTVPAGVAAAHVRIDGVVVICDLERMDFAKISRTIIRYRRSCDETLVDRYQGCGDWHNGFAWGCKKPAE